MVTEKNRKKIVFVKSGQYDILKKDIDLNQLEMKYGGTKPNLRMGEYWYMIYSLFSLTLSLPLT